jgi:hypothetical protein
MVIVLVSVVWKGIRTFFDGNTPAINTQIKKEEI